MYCQLIIIHNHINQRLIKLLETHTHETKCCFDCSKYFVVLFSLLYIMFLIHIPQLWNVNAHLSRAFMGYHNLFRRWTERKMSALGIIYIYMSKVRMKKMCVSVMTNNVQKMTLIVKFECKNISPYDKSVWFTTLHFSFHTEIRLPGNSNNFLVFTLEINGYVILILFKSPFIQ